MKRRFRITLDYRAETMQQAIDLLLGATEMFPWPSVIGIESPTKPRPTKGRLPSAPALSETLESASSWLKDNTFTLHFGELSSLGLGQHVALATASASLATDAGLFEDPGDCVDRLIWLIRQMLNQDVLISASMVLFGEMAARCVPYVPLAGTQLPLILTTDAEIAKVYERPDDFLSAGWDVERRGGHILLTRLRNVVHPAPVLREIRDHQWQMARAAKPRLTKFGDPVIAPSEQEIFEAGEHGIQLVGVNAAGLCEFSSALEEGDHLQGFDVYYVREIVKKQQLRNGTPVKEVRVVFLNKPVAEVEKRPLLDVGARVFYMDKGGDIELVD